MENGIVTLNNGVGIPILGLGVFQARDGSETSDAVRWAIEAGYRHIDTASVYRNEAGVGRGIRESGIRREELFVTTKLWNDDIRAARVQAAFHESLKLLALDYIDLYLIHWPVDGFPAAWESMERLLQAGKIRAIGVSNFQPHHLDALARESDTIPVVNQIECHPLLTQKPLKAYCGARGIACEAWSPLGGTGGNLLEHPEIQAIAEEYGRSPAQIVLRWDIQNDIIAIPKSIHRERIRSNLDVFGFSLSDKSMARIDALNLDKRVGPDPDSFDF